MKLYPSLRLRLRRPLLAATALASLALSTNAIGIICLPPPNAVGFLRLGDIKGEATDDGHKEWINLLSVSQSITRPLLGDSSTPTLRRRGDVVLGDIVCVKELDKASPKLMEALCTGVILPSLEFELTRSSGDGTGRQVPYLRYELKNVIVTSYSVSGATGGDPLPTEEVSFNYGEIKVIYTEVDKATGASKGNVEFSWKVEEGAK